MVCGEGRRRNGRGREGRKRDGGRGRAMKGGNAGKNEEKEGKNTN